MAKFRLYHPRDSLDAVGDSWKERSAPVPHDGIRRLRDTLSFKNTRLAHSEKEFLKKECRCTMPLTQRNMDTLLTEQDQHDAVHSVQKTLDGKGKVSEWLQQLP
jgi:hypothetical protein